MVKWIKNINREINNGLIKYCFIKRNVLILNKFICIKINDK